MKLEQFEKTYDGFYVPTAVVKVGGRDLVRDLFLAVTSVEVTLKLNGAGSFSFTVASAFSWEEREFVSGAGLERIDLLDLFAFGTSVNVAIGYGEPARLKPMIKGIVTEISTSFAESGNPALKVKGMDALYPLGLGKTSRQWEKRRRSDAVRAVAGENSLPVDIKAKDSPEERIEQKEISDLVFIGEMAKKTSSIFYIRDGILYFGPRQSDKSARAEIAWGEGLSSFTPTANLAKQVTEVEVHGWSALKGERIVGKARRGDEQGVDRNGKSGGQRAAQAIGKTPILKISAAAHTQEEADARAKAILRERAQDFVTGDGECVGLPDLLPDTNVTVSGVGRAFSKDYYIDSTTHSLDSKGYRTRFHVEESSV